MGQLSLLIFLASKTFLLPNDAVEVDIWHQPNLSGKYLVDADTNLNIPILGAILVKNIAIDSLERLLIEKLHQYYGDVFATVNMYYRINVFGEVKVPGNYYLKASDNLANLLSQAGGPTENGNLGKIRIVNVGTRRVVNFESIIKSGKNLDLLNLQSGDVVIVPRRFLSSLQEWSVLFTVGTFLLQVYNTYLTAIK